MGRWVSGITALALVWAWGSLAQPEMISALDVDPVPRAFSHPVEAEEMPWYLLDPSYMKLRQALATYQRIAVDGGWAAISKGATLQRGDRGERVAALRARLQATGDLQPPLLYRGLWQDELPTDADAWFDDELDQAVRAWQRRHGLQVDGLVGPKTLAALNVPVPERIRQIEQNLERWQRDEREPGERYILINIPDFSLDVVESHQSIMRMRVVVGKPEEDWRTPVFRATMRYLVLNPSWQIPPTIAKKEILPRVLKDPSFLTRNNMQVVQGWGAATRTIDASTIDWTTVTPKTFPYRFRQNPGAGNWLGRIKFIFPNRFYVYLHDTPTRSLFRRSSRAFSHGCVRVERPLDLAAYILRESPIWTPEHIVDTIQHGVEKRVNLSQTLPVHVVYRTVWVDENGTVQFRRDIYGYDMPQAADVTDNRVKRTPAPRRAPRSAPATPHAETDNAPLPAATLAIQPSC